MRARRNWELVRLPVVDLETHQVIGLHFGGRYGHGNYAVPLWILSADPLLAKGGINFQ